MMAIYDYRPAKGGHKFKISGWNPIRLQLSDNPTAMVNLANATASFSL